VGVHIPPISNVGKNNTEVTSRTMHSNSDSPILASSVVVSTSSAHVPRRAKKVTFMAEAIKTATHEQVSSGNKEPSVTRLAAMQQAVQDQGYSEAVAVRMASSRRPGTNKLYQSRWGYWQKWCRENGWDPNVPSSPRLTEFLLYIFNTKGWSISTIKGYSSTICTTLKVISGKDLSTDPVLKELLNSFFHERPVSRCSTPKWNLAKVLNSLCEGPYEPIAKARLKYLTWKTVFLVTLASGKRSGEIYALTDLVTHAQDWSQVILRPSVGFLAKTHTINRPEAAFSELIIPSLLNILPSKKEKDYLLCPVRALRHYLASTKKFRNRKKQTGRLFLSYNNMGVRDIAKSSISAWLRETILWAYKSDQEQKDKVYPRAHELRALSASWLALRTRSLDQILKAASWSSHNTFTNFYLRDLTYLEKDMLVLGPLVVSQQVVHPRKPSAAKSLDVSAWDPSLQRTSFSNGTMVRNFFTTLVIHCLDMTNYLTNFRVNG